MLQGEEIRIITKVNSSKGVIVSYDPLSNAKVLLWLVDLRFPYDMIAAVKKPLVAPFTNMD